MSPTFFAWTAFPWFPKKVPRSQPGAPSQPSWPRVPQITIQLALLIQPFLDPSSPPLLTTPHLEPKNNHWDKHPLSELCPVRRPSSVPFQVRGKTLRGCLWPCHLMPPRDQDAQPHLGTLGMGTAGGLLLASSFRHADSASGPLPTPLSALTVCLPAFP